MDDTDIMHSFGNPAVLSEDPWLCSATLHGGPATQSHWAAGSSDCSEFAIIENAKRAIRVSRMIDC